MIQGLGGERVIDHYEWQGYLIILLEAAADKFRNPNEFNINFPCLYVPDRLYFLLSFLFSCFGFYKIEGGVNMNFVHSRWACNHARIMLQNQMSVLFSTHASAKFGH